MNRRAKALAALGVAVAAGAAGYGARYAAHRVRSRRADDPYADHSFTPLAEVEHAVESLDGAKIHVIEAGTGVPVVLAHGVTNDHRVWSHQLDDLPAVGVRAIAYDQRGHGRSTVGDLGFGVDPLADDLRAVLEGLDVRGAVLVGHSMGGMGVQAFACRYPELLAERVAGVVLMGTTSHALRLWKTLERLPDDLSARGDVVFQRLVADDRLGGFAVRAALGRRPHASHVAITRQMVAECPPDTRRLATRALLEYDVRDLICDIPVPVLVMCGTRDLLTPARASRGIAGAIPGARLELLPRAGHMPMLERDEAVTRLLAEFAAEVQPA